nr:hypothetical protein [Tanacetum cinerariifolium]
MSRDVLTVGSTIRIPLLYREEYSQWVERFMNYLEEQTDGEAMIISIKNGDQPLPPVTQVSIAGTTSTEQPPLKDKSMWQNQNLMDINIDALYNILKQNQGDVNDAMGSKKKTIVVMSDPLALIAEKTNVSRSKEKVVVSSDSEGTEDQALMESSSDSDQEINANMVFMAQIKKVLFDSEARSSSTDKKNSEQNQGDVNDAMGSKKKTVVVTSDPLALIAEKTNVSRSKGKVVVSSDSKGSEADDFNELKKITAFDLDQEINANMVFMTQIKKVLSDSEARSSSTDKKISEKNMQNLRLKDEYMIRYSAYFDNDKQHRKQIADQQVLYDKMSVQLVELDKPVRDLKNMVLEKDFKISKLEECVRNKDLEIEKCLERLNVCENK